MRLTELRIDRLPGIDSPFALEAARLGEGLHVIVGPNESGKSSICRAVRQLLWEEAPGEERSSSVRVRGRWSGGGHDWTAEREGSGSPRWQRDGIESPAPPLPDVHLARCYTLGIRDLLSDDTDSTDERLAARIRQELAGGYDLERVLRERFDVGKAIGRKEKGALKERRAELEARIRKQKEIAERQNSLGNLKGERDDARRAQVRLKTLELALDLAVERAALVAATRLLEELPPGMERLGGNEGEILRQLDADIDENDGEQRDQQALLEESSGGPAGRAGGVTDPPPSEATLGVWLERAVQLEGAERSRDAARKAAAAARARLADARATLARGIDPEGAQDVTPEAVDRAASILRRAERNAVRREALERWRGQLPELSPEEDERADPLRRGVEALEDWHAAPAPAPAAREVRRLLWLTASLALLLAILGVFLGSVTHPAGWGLLLPAAAALLLAARIGGESKRPMGEG
ncbi:MAG: AAA family ATPase, partial [Planctomycetota bacterium]